MVRVGKSKCYCGKCQTAFEGEWELEYINGKERSMGEESEYSGELYVECPGCGNAISGSMEVLEYPPGCLNQKKVTEISDSEKTGKSRAEEPVVEFFDL